MLHTYQVAEHIFAIDAADPLFEQLPNYAPFQLEITNHKSQITTALPIDRNHHTPVFTIRVNDDALPTADGWTPFYTDRSEDDMPRIEMYRRAGEWLFFVALSRDGEIVSALRCSEDWKEVELYVQPDTVRFAVDNAAMLVYAFATANQQTLLFHSSVTVLDHKAYMFLGHSGTGKSTHSRQWKTAFPEAFLLNDDNPAVRILSDGSVRVYGTPWSGKTPCYKNESAPVQALVQLVQAPANKIERLRMSQAYPYVLASVSGLKVMPQMMDALFETIAKLLEISPVYRLECLPDKEAAQICCAAINGSNS